MKRITNWCTVATGMLMAILPQTGLLAADDPIESLMQEPRYYDTAEADIQLRVIASGLDHPWSIRWLPDGTTLVTEKNAGVIRRIVDDELLEEPVLGGPQDLVFGRYKGVLDVAPHPDFENQPWLYVSYNKDLGDNREAVAVARGRWDGTNIQGLEDIFVAQEGTVNGLRLLFGTDGMLYLGVYVPGGPSPDDFDTLSQEGKILRLTPEGEIPADNPFVGRDDFLPEIYSYGHRTPTGLTMNRQTGEIWNTEMGPLGGDEVNRVVRGGNYGWPLVSLGRRYDGPWQSEHFQMEGVIDPVHFWMPGISPSSLVFYESDEIPAWEGDLFVSAQQEGRIPGTGQLQRIKLNDDGNEIMRERLFDDLGQRIRDVKLGPDGRLWLLTDEDNGLMMRIEPAGN